MADEQPDPVAIHEIGAGGYWTGETTEIASDAGCPQGWTRTPLPELGTDEFAVFENLAWTVTDLPFEPIGPTLDELRRAKLLALADYRWQREVAGVMIGGAPIATDRESQAKLTSAYVLAVANPTFSLRWKVALGQFVTLDAATIVIIGDAVGAYVRACFDREDVLTTEILTAVDAEALAEIDIEADWP
jgi:hypothetical protein